MAKFQFKAFYGNFCTPIEVEVFLSDKSRGVTPREPDKYLEIISNENKSISWFAMKWNCRVARGESAGGRIHILVEHPACGAAFD
jgi:hypothetical protein